jgi:protease-4
MSANWLRNRTLVYNPVPVQKNQPKRFQIGRMIWNILKRASMALGAMMLISITISAIMFSQIPTEKPVILPDTMVLHYNLSHEIRNRGGAESYLAELGFIPPEITLPDVIRALNKASKDDRVKGFVLTLNGGNYTLSQIQDLRDAIKQFKSSGKFTKIYAPSYGEIGSGLGAYYLASVFDEIWMQPVGMVAVTGLYAEAPYLKGLLDRFGVKAEFFQRKDYKTAMENLTASQMSPKSHEMMQSVVTSIGDTIAGDIARDRSKVGGQFRSLMNTGLFTDTESLNAKLIDQLGYEDDLRLALFKKINLPPNEDLKIFTSLKSYLSEPTKQITTTTIAHIFISGAIIEQMDNGGYQFQEKFADAKGISTDILNAAKSKSVSALLIEVNSPGGSPSASETIRRAIELAKTKYKKPIYIVMKDAAASGGYWVSVNADKIFARPTTLTGSIGVVGGKFTIEKLSSDYGVNWDGVQYGDNAGLFGINKSFSQSESERYNATLDSVYDHFIKRVSTGRKLSPDTVEQIAQGRVWTGLQAKIIGLVDELGGNEEALTSMAKQLGKSKNDLALVEWPLEKSPLDAFRAIIGEASPISVMLNYFGFKTELLSIPQARMVYEPLWDIRQ